MALIDELKERRAEVVAELETQEAFVVAHQTCVEDKRTEIADLDRAIAALEPTPEPDQQASALEDAKRIEGASEVVPVPGAGEESRDHSDDASEFAEEGYAPVVEAEPLADPIWNEPEPTKPEADSIAKALDHYDPKAVAERERFNPFNIFKREGDQ